MARRTHNDRTITAVGLERLLARLHPDRERAAAEYEHLRRALVRFFEWRGGRPADECADEAIDRLAGRLEQDTAVEDVRKYAHGIARLVLLERRRQPSDEPLDDDRAPIARAGVLRDDSAERLRDCLDRCLDDLDGDNRSVMLEYYEGERSSRIAKRRRMAARLGLSENALRSRLRRLRDRLERCVTGCTKQGA
jgi:DNA-directed RNA polymerase specialized sigma24 family protein